MTVLGKKMSTAQRRSTIFLFSGTLIAIISLVSICYTSSVIADTPATSTSLNNLKTTPLTGTQLHTLLQRLQTTQSLEQRSTTEVKPNGFFKQTKTLQGLPFPIQSSGHYTLNRDRIDWQTTEPTSTLTTFTSNGSVTDGIDNAHSEAFSSIFIQLLQGNIAPLKQQFNVAAYARDTSNSMTEEQWALTLIPSNALLKKFIQNIDLQLSSENNQQVTLSSILINEANGDATQIVFSETIE